VFAVKGHHDEVWGLTVHPSQKQFMSVGYDKMLYLWDTLTRRAVWAKQLPVSCSNLVVVLLVVLLVVVAAAAVVVVVVAAVVAVAVAVAVVQYMPKL